MKQHLNFAKDMFIFFILLFAVKTDIKRH